MPNHVNNIPVIRGGMNLRAHLRDAIFLFGNLSDAPRLGNRVRQRLLTIDVAPALQSRHRGHGMNGIGRAYDDCVKIIALQHFSKITIARSFGKFLPGRGQQAGIDIAQGDDVFGGGVMKSSPRDWPCR